MKAIPTTYRFTRFRSRLEARWAAFFDLVGWRWVYEPADYDGWTPDFMLIGKGRNVLVEVKPINWSEDDGYDGAYWGEHRAEVMKAVREWRGLPVLLLGTSPILSSKPAVGAVFAEWAFGIDEDDPLVVEYPTASDFAETAELVYFTEASGQRRYDFRQEHVYGGSELFDLHRPCCPQVAEVADLWNEAGSQVQWHPQKQMAGYTYAGSIVARGVAPPLWQGERPGSGDDL